MPGVLHIEVYDISSCACMFRLLREALGTLSLRSVRRRRCLSRFADHLPFCARERGVDELREFNAITLCFENNYVVFVSKTTMLCSY